MTTSSEEADKCSWCYYDGSDCSHTQSNVSPAIQESERVSENRLSDTGTQSNEDGEWVHAVQLTEGAYIVSPEFAKEIEKHTIKKQQVIGDIYGMKIAVSDTLPYFEKAKEDGDEPHTER